jgi:hypothetical protein
MIEQCEKCALYNSLGCPYSPVGITDDSDCDEYRPNEEAKITDPIKKRLFKLLQDSPSLNVLYEEQWTESVDYLVSNGITLKSEDMVEVVRCKDCYYCEEMPGVLGMCLYCNHWCKDVDSNTYCSNGVKIEK